MEKEDKEKKKDVVITLEFTPLHGKVFIGKKEIIRRGEEKTISKEVYDKIKNIKGIKKLK